MKRGKRAVSSILCLLLCLPFLVGFGYSALPELPDIYLRWAIEDFLSAQQLKEVKSLEYAAKHARDEPSNSDTMTVELTVDTGKYAYSAEFTNTYQYDWSSRNWNRIRESGLQKRRLLSFQPFSPQACLTCLLASESPLADDVGENSVHGSADMAQEVVGDFGREDLASQAQYAWYIENEELDFTGVQFSDSESARSMLDSFEQFFRSEEYSASVLDRTEGDSFCLVRMSAWDCEIDLLQTDRVAYFLIVYERGTRVRDFLEDFLLTVHNYDTW